MNWRMRARTDPKRSYEQRDRAPSASALWCVASARQFFWTNGMFVQSAISSLNLGVASACLRFWVGLVSPEPSSRRCLPRRKLALRSLPRLFDIPSTASTRTRTHYDVAPKGSVVSIGHVSVAPGKTRLRWMKIAHFKVDQTICGTAIDASR